VAQSRARPRVGGHDSRGVWGRRHGTQSSPADGCEWSFPLAFLDEAVCRDSGKQQELPARELIGEIIEWFLDDVLDELGTRKEVEYACLCILDEGSSADR
jgi:hypothetical protein